MTKSSNRSNTVPMLQVGEAPSPRLSGLLTRDLVNGTTRWYNGVDREVELRVESRSIFLPNVTCDDAGAYVCHLAAPVGEQNKEGLVLLTLTGKSQHVTSLLSEISQADFPNFPSSLLGKRDLNLTHGTRWFEHVTCDMIHRGSFWTYKPVSSLSGFNCGYLWWLHPVSSSVRNFTFCFHFQIVPTELQNSWWQTLTWSFLLHFCWCWRL